MCSTSELLFLITTAKVTTMKNMFSGATSFNNGGQPLTLDTAKVQSVSTCTQPCLILIPMKHLMYIFAAFTDEGTV